MTHSHISKRAHRIAEAERENLRVKFIDALRRENYGGGAIPPEELEHALREVGLWQVNGRVV